VSIGRRIAFLGLGAMGSRMASRLVAAGHELMVWNRSPERVEQFVAKGARAVSTPANAAEEADIVISMVRDDEAARAVWLDPNSGALKSLSSHAIAIESSTTTPNWARELYAACVGIGVSCIDAPVVGSRPQAEAGQLIFLVGGDAETVKHIEPILLAMGSVIHHTGPAGTGCVVKLMVNALFGVQVAALAELMALASRAGLDPARAIEIVTSTPAASLAAKGAAASMLARAFVPLFPIELVEKDFCYALQVAGSAEYAPLTAATREVFSRAIREGFGAQNLTAVAQLYS
jgi:3-hydroxyisobutyrate dehydrogenase